MAELAPGISAILAQSRSGFLLPAVTVDTSQMQLLFEALCNQVLQLSRELQNVRSQLAEKADYSEIANLQHALSHERAANAENFNRLSSNMGHLKDALVSGLDRCLKDAGDMAQVMLSDIKMPETVVIERAGDPQSTPEEREVVPHTVYIQSPAPYPTADLSELTQQISSLIRRVTTMEERAMNSPIRQRPEPVVYWREVPQQQIPAGPIQQVPAAPAQQQFLIVSSSQSLELNGRSIQA
jgi:hypothetical protein